MASESMSGFLDIRAAAPFLVAAVVFYFLVEQLSIHRKKGPLPGPPLVVPFLGSFAHMTRDPAAFWGVQAERARESGTGLAADYLIGRFIVFVRDSELSNRVFANVRPDAFHLTGLARGPARVRVPAREAGRGAAGAHARGVRAGEQGAHARRRRARVPGRLLDAGDGAGGRRGGRGGAAGAGAHRCVGQRYALNHLVLFMALFVSHVDIRRERTDGCDDAVYMPTIVPKDGCSVYLEQRCAKFPSF